MEEKAADVKTPETNQKSESTSTKHKDPFSVFGKIAAVVIVAALLIGGGAYLGMSLNKNSNQNGMQTTPTPQASPTTVMQESPTSSQTPVVNHPLEVLTTAGGAPGTSFTTYTINVPADWTPKEDKTSVSDKLTLTKGSSTLTITQAAMGGGGCLYPGDPASEMAQTFTDFADIKGVSTTFRRSFNKGNDPTISYTICQKASDASYGSPTQFGAINVIAPSSTSTETLAQIDQMIASLTKK